MTTYDVHNSNNFPLKFPKVLD